MTYLLNEGYKKIDIYLQVIWLNGMTDCTWIVEGKEFSFFFGRDIIFEHWSVDTFLFEIFLYK